MLLPNSYTMLVALGACMGVAIACWQTRSWHVLTDATITGICALGLGRLGYAALHWGYFADHIPEIFSLSSPGFQEHAALCGGFIGNWLMAKRHVSIANRQLPIAISLIGMAASLGCIANGCAYGREVFWQVEGEHSLAWFLAVDWPDAYTINSPRLPTQLFMAAWLLLVGFAVLLIGKGDKGTRGQGDKASPLLLVSLSPCPSLWLLLFALGDFVIQFARADASVIWGGLRAEQWADMVLGVVAGAAVVCAGIVRKSRSQGL